MVLFKTIKKSALLSMLVVLLIAPFVALAQPPPHPTPIGIAPDVLVFNIFILVLDILWMVSILFVVVMFTLAGFQYLTAKGDPGKVSEAHKAVIWGTVGVAVVVLAWSIITIIRVQFGT